MKTRISRRDALRWGLAGAGAAALGGPSDLPLLAARLAPARTAANPPDRQAGAKAKSVIQIWLWGGASHLDTFDPKPDAGQDYHGGMNKPLATNVDGIRIHETLPLLAQKLPSLSLFSAVNFHGMTDKLTGVYFYPNGPVDLRAADKS